MFTILADRVIHPNSQQPICFPGHRYYNPTKLVHEIVAVGSSQFVGGVSGIRENPEFS